MDSNTLDSCMNSSLTPPTLGNTFADQRVSLARVREVVRRYYPDLCPELYAKSQHDPCAVPEYVKQVLIQSRI